MRKYLFLALAFFVLSVSPTFAIYSEESESTSTESIEATAEPTSKTTRELKASDKKMMLMTATEEKKTARMEALEEMKEKSKEAREEFKTKMKEIRDEKKQKALENLDTRISEKNKKWTEKMSERLERLTQILAKLGEKGALPADITTATTAIDDAKSAVTDQAAKDYVVEVTTEEELRIKASATIKEFMTDIKAVHQKVVDAQKAVAKVARGLKPTVTITPSPTEGATP